MDLSNLKPAQGSVKKGKRLGRGQGSGRGGTSTRGHKGAKARSGYSEKIAFEGGQMPLIRRLPKFGFNSLDKIEYKAINLNVLQSLSENAKINSIDVKVLFENGLISKNDKVKILGNGQLTNKLNVKAHAFSKKAKESIESLQGTVEII